MARNSKATRRIPRKKAKSARQKQSRQKTERLESSKFSRRTSDINRFDASRLALLSRDEITSLNIEDKEYELCSVFSKEKK